MGQNCGWFGEPRRLPRPGKSPGEAPKPAPRPPNRRQQRPNPQLLQDQEVVGSVVHDQEYRNGHDLYPFRYYPNNAGGRFGSPGKYLIYQNILRLSRAWRKNPFLGENLGTRGKMPGCNLHPMRCGLMFRIGRMRSARHKTSDDELLIGFLPILLKSCHGPLIPISLSIATNRSTDKAP